MRSLKSESQMFLGGYLLDNDTPERQLHVITCDGEIPVRTDAKVRLISIPSFWVIKDKLKQRFIL